MSQEEQEVEDLDPQEYPYICKGCGDRFKTLPELGTHSRTCKEYKDWKQAQEGEKELRERAEEKDGREWVSPPEVEIVEEARNFCEERLDQIYGVGKTNKNVVVKALWDDPSPLRDPTALHNFVKSLAPKTHDRQLEVLLIRPLYRKMPELPMMVERVISANRGPNSPIYGGQGMGGMNYNPSYQDIQQKFYGPPYNRGMNMQSSYPQHSQYGYDMRHPFQPQPPSKDAVTRRDLEELKREMREEKEKDRLEKKIDELQERMAYMQQQESQSRQQVTEKIPIDADGNPTNEKEAVSFIIRQRPVEGKESSAIEAIRSELREVKGALKDNQIEGLRDQIRTLETKVSEEPKKSPEMEVLKEQLDKANQTIEGFKEQMEQEKYNALVNEIRGLERRFQSLDVGEWKTDEARLLSNAVNNLTGMLRDKQPAQIAKELLTGQGYMQPLPSERDAGGYSPQAQESILKELEKEGLVENMEVE